MMVGDDTEDCDCQSQLIQALREYRFEDAHKLLSTWTVEGLQKRYWLVLPEALASIDKAEESGTTDCKTETLTDIIDTLAEHAKPKELLILYIESLSSSESFFVYDSILFNITKCLKAHPVYPVRSFIWVLEVIAGQLTKLETPPTVWLETDEERCLARNSSEATKIIDRLESFLSLLEENQAFMVQQRVLESTSISLRLQICSRILSPLAHTLGHLDLDEPESKARALALGLATVVASSVDPISVFKLAKCNRPNQKKDEEDNLSTDSDSVAVFAHILFCLDRTFARVYSAESMSRHILTFGLVLMNSPFPSMILKGIELLVESRPFMVGVDSDNSNHILILNALRALIQLSGSIPCLDYRKMAVGCWKDILTNYESNYRNDIISALFSIMEVPGIRGILIDEWRYLYAQHPEAVKVPEVLGKIAKLPEAETTDLREHKEEIFATLAWLKFLLIRQCLDVKCVQVEKYLVDLRKGIRLSEHNYNLQLAENQGETSAKALTPNVPQDPSADIIRMSITTFQLMGTTLDFIDALYQKITK